MSIKRKRALQTLLIFSIVFTSVISLTLYAQNQAQEQERTHRAHEIAKIIAVIIETPLKNKDMLSVQSFIERLVSLEEINFLSLSFQDKKFNSHSQTTTPKEELIIFNQPIEIDDKKMGMLTLGYQSHEVNSPHFPNEQSMIWGSSIIGLLSILTIYLLLQRLISPLRQLYNEQEEITPKTASHSMIFQEDIYATIKMIRGMKEKLKISDEELKTSLINKLHSDEQIRQIEGKYIAIYNASHDAIIVANDNDVVIEFSPVAEQIFGWSRDEIVGKTMADTIVPLHLRDAHLNGIKHFMNTGEGPVLNNRIELSALHRNGKIFQIEICISTAKTKQGHLFVSYIRDITQRIKDQTELKLAAHAFETSEAMFIADNKGHIIRINPGFSAVTGYTAIDVQGRKPRTLLANSEDIDFHKKVWLELNEKGMWSSELNLRHKNGHEIPVHMSMTAVSDKTQTLSHVVAHFFDMSAQKETEQILREAQNAAELANESKSRFLAAMSHEIRTPMNGVIGVLGLLKDTPLNSQQRNLVLAARDSGEILFTIINDILDFSKMEAGKLMLENNPFDLHALIIQTLNIIDPQARNKALTLTSEIEKETPRFLIGDGDRIRQIMINLLSNAIKYTAKGDVEVNVRSLGVTDHLCDIQIDIKDTGIGIASKDMPHLFDEFTMVENTYARTNEGSGLGLAICKQLVDLMEGSLNVKSVLGEGSTFTLGLRLKLAEEKDITQIQLDAAPSTHLVSKDCRILMAEDNPANQMVLRTMLEFSGLFVDIVSNGLEAVEAVKKFDYDIVFMDISMPEVDGLEATRRIRALKTPEKDVIIVALTAHAIRGDKEHFLTSGMNDFISKPVTRRAILDCLARWQPKMQEREKSNLAIALHSKGDENPELFLSRALPPLQGKLVDEKTLTQLIQDTSVDIMESLLENYLIDGKTRLKNIGISTQDRDFYALEFEVHTIGSSAAAHGNTRLSALCRTIELHCQLQEYDDAIIQAALLQTLARDSFGALKKRIGEGFTL